MRYQTAVPSLQWHRLSPHMDIPVLTEQDKGLGENQENYGREGILDLCQGSLGVTGVHGVSHSCPPRSEALIAIIKMKDCLRSHRFSHQIHTYVKLK